MTVDVEEAIQRLLNLIFQTGGDQIVIPASWVDSTLPTYAYRHIANGSSIGQKGNFEYVIAYANELQAFVAVSVQYAKSLAHMDPPIPAIS